MIIHHRVDDTGDKLRKTLISGTPWVDFYSTASACLNHFSVNTSASGSKHVDRKYKPGLLQLPMSCDLPSADKRI